MFEDKFVKDRLQSHGLIGGKQILHRDMDKQQIFPFNEYADMIEMHFRNGDSVLTMDNEFFPIFDGEEFFDQRKESENLDQNLEQSMIPDMNVLRMAYLIEEDFRDYYKSMAKKVDDGELKEILENFSSWEDEHANIFKKEYDKLMDQYMNISWGG